MSKVKTLKNLSAKSYGLNVFLLGLLLSAAFIVPVIIEQGGIFFYYGDFNAQEIPFYQLVHDEIQRGHTNWSNLTDLGTPLISSYLFYLIGSPFFLVTLLFPSEAVPYLMGPLFMLKFAFASLTAYLYIRRYVQKPFNAVLGGLMYAFSGFSIYNIFFFHFHEPMIFFPLLLYAVDKFMYENKRGLLAVCVFAACIVNYYFFAGMAVFTAAYWLMLVFTNNYRLTAKKLLLFVFEVLLGFAATAFLVLPTVFFIMGNPRLSSFPDGYDSVVYDISQKYSAILSCFFFPPDLAAQPNFAPDANAKWASLGAWLPLFGMTGVIAYLQLKKRDWLKKLILLLALFALVPLFNYMFQALNASIFYARWYYMFTLILVLATVRAVEDKETDWSRAFRWSAGITFVISLLIGFMPNTYEDENGDEAFKIGLQEYDDRFWIYVAIAMFSLATLAMIIFLFKNKPKMMTALLLAGFCLISILSSTYIVQTGNSLDYDEKEYLKEYAVNKIGSIDIDDIDTMRSDFFECPDNLQMYWQIQSINTFHSVVSSGIMDFYESVESTRDVASRPEIEKYGIRGLLSCKYLFDAEYDDDDEEYSFVDEDGKTKMPGWKYLKSINGCSVYENKNYIPMGFTFDSFISKHEFNEIDSRHKSEAVLKALVLSNKDLLKYSDITGYAKDDINEIKRDIKNGTNEFDSKTTDFDYGTEYYSKDCKKLAENTCEKFSYTDKGFNAVFNNKGDDNLLFFSIPYDDGWTAYVNGRKTDIAKVDFGLMAVKVNGHTKNDIVFVYQPVGFYTGIIISASCAIIFVMYLIAASVIRRKRGNRGKK
ncbi:MAG: YfhO family protein [Ruminococcus sp.]|nr:YfhO family protein [Ruminococcus sp.]